MNKYLQAMTMSWCFISAFKSVSSLCFHMDHTLFRQNTVLDGLIFQISLQSTPRNCMQECLSFSACGSVNIYPANLRCELVLQSSTEKPDKLLASTSGLAVDAKDIPQDYAGTCRNHTCPVTDKCVGLTSGQYLCVKYDHLHYKDDLTYTYGAPLKLEFCSGLPATIDKTTYAVDISRGVPSALYSCIPGAGHVSGDKTSYCDPLTNTWSLATVVCSTEMPAACGDPPPVNTDTFTRPYEGNAYKAWYTCKTFSGVTPSEHCPITTCTGIEQWTPVASVSCTTKDCVKNTDYVGSVTCTKSGRTCQRWDSQSPHSHGYFTSSDLNNYCRISHDTVAPWCYTTDSAVRWEYCPVPNC